MTLSLHPQFSCHPVRRKSIRLLLPALLVFVLMSAAVAQAAGNSIRLQNRTYTPLWYQVKSSASQFSEWRSVRPGSTIHYSQHPSLVIKVALGKYDIRDYTIERGKTYILKRSSAWGRPRFITTKYPDWSRMQPPSAAEFRRARSYVSTGNEFAPLERFIDRSERSGATYRLSLRKLAADCRKASKYGRLPAELRYVRGFTWFFGYMIDQENADVILLGVKDPTRPPIDIDCLATAIKAAYTGRVPACSLDPHPNPKYQKSVVRGVPWNTRWAQVMIDADYDMKKVSQGHLNPQIPGLQSQFAMSVAQFKRTLRTGRNTNRFWFNFDSTRNRALVDGSGALAVLFNNPVRLSTEKQVAGKYGTGTTDSVSVRFAWQFSRHMDTIAKHYPSVAELQAMYRMYDLLSHVRKLGRVVLPEMKYWMAEYRHPYSGPPQTMPTLSRSTAFYDYKYGKKYRFTFKVKGGVNMRLQVTPSTVRRTTADRKLVQRLLLAP